MHTLARLALPNRCQRLSLSETNPHVGSPTCQISVMLDQFPKYFFVNEDTGEVEGESLVSFSAAYDQLCGPLQDYIWHLYGTRLSDEHLNRCG